jgi:hypothetical protein
MAERRESVSTQVPKASVVMVKSNVIYELLNKFNLRRGRSAEMRAQPCCNAHSLRLQPLRTVFGG